METIEFKSTIQAIHDIRKFMTQQRTMLFSEMGQVEERIESAYHHALYNLSANGSEVARMASQILESSDLSPSQTISLKAALTQLEFEIQLCDSI